MEGCHIQFKHLCGIQTTLKVVKSLCGPFKGAYHTIYIDRLYTSIGLFRELYDILIFDIVQFMKNHITKELTMANS